MLLREQKPKLKPFESRWFILLSRRRRRRRHFRRCVRRTIVKTRRRKEEEEEKKRNNNAQILINCSCVQPADFRVPTEGYYFYTLINDCENKNEESVERTAPTLAASFFSMIVVLSSLYYT